MRNLFIRFIKSMTPNRWTFAFQKIGILTTTFVTLLAFQNCSPGFVVRTNEVSSPSLDSQTGLALGSLNFQSPEANFPVQNILTISGACSADVMIEVTGDVLATAAFPCSNGAFSKAIELSGADGIKNVILSQTDRLGNRKVDSRNFVKDTKAPVVQFATSITEGLLVGKSLILSGTCETGLKVKVVLSDSEGLVECANDQFSTTLDLNGRPDGSLNVRIEQTDLVGLTGSQSRNLLKRTSALMVKIVSPAEGAQVTSPLAISGTCSNGVDVQLSGTALTEPVRVPCTNSAFSLNSNLSSGFGAKTLMAVQTDSVGNTGSETRNVTVQAPTLPPLAVNITSPDANTVSRTGITLSGTCVNGLPVVISGTGVAASSSAACNNGAFTAAVTFSNGDGAKLIQVSQMNTTTNNSGLDSRSFIRDSTPPLLAVLTPAAAAVFQSTFTITGNCETGLNVNLAGSGIDQTSSTTCTNGMFTANLRLSTGEGNKSISLASTDRAGNTTTITHNLVKDSLPPQLALQSPAAGTVVDTQVTLTGTCENTIAVIVQGAGARSMVTGNCTNSTFSLTVMMTDGDGTKTILISQTDLAGNKTEVSRSFTRQTPTPILSGEQLYANNCASCHNVLKDSTKKGKSAAEIAMAIESVGAMKFLSSSLNATQIQAIADVLKVTAPPVALSCNDPNNRGLAKRGLRRLTFREIYALMKNANPNSFWKFEQEDTVFEFVRDVEEVPYAEKFPEFHSFSFLSEWAGAVDRYVEYVAKDAYVGGPMVDGCFYASSTLTLDCWKKTVAVFGKVFWRRPLQTAEIDYIASLNTGLPKIEAARRIFGYVLMAPDFLYHFETQGTPNGERIRITNFDLANRISYATTGLPPDRTLMQAAESNQLSTLAQVETQVRRLLGTSQARGKINAFLDDWLQLSSVSAATLLHYWWGDVQTRNSSRPDWTVGDLKQELYDFFYHIVFVEKGTFQDLMTKKVAVPRKFSATGSVPGAAYGINISTITNTDDTVNPVAYPAPNHPGLLTRAALLSAGTDHTSPIRRGVKVIRRVLCEDLPSPDALTIAERNDDFSLYDPTKFPNHEITSRVTAAPVCMTCHQSINSTGFLFESFDPLGRKRTQEHVILNDYEPFQTKTHPLPGPVANLFIEEGLPTSFNTVEEYTNAIARSQKAMSCISKGLLRHYERRKETELDKCALDESKNLLVSNQPVLEAIVKSIANEDIFWRDGR